MQRLLTGNQRLDANRLACLHEVRPDCSLGSAMQTWRQQLQLRMPLQYIYLPAQLR